MFFKVNCKSVSASASGDGRTIDVKIEGANLNELLGEFSVEEIIESLGDKLLEAMPEEKMKKYFHLREIV